MSPFCTSALLLTVTPCFVLFLSPQLFVLFVCQRGTPSSRTPLTHCCHPWSFRISTIIFTQRCSRRPNVTVFPVSAEEGCLPPSPTDFAVLTDPISSAPALHAVVRHAMSPESLTPLPHLPVCRLVLLLHPICKRLHRICPDTRGLKKVQLCHSKPAIWGEDVHFRTLPDPTCRSGHSWECQQTRNPKKTQRCE